jgi:aminoglycoside/choline kinase family phosphotransferase
VDILPQEISLFLEKALNSKELKVLPLAGDASNRRYYRVIRGEESWVLMRWEPFDPNSYPFLSVLRHFSEHGVHVPKVEGLDSERGLVLLEDLGDLTLERKFWENQVQENSFLFYQLAVDELIKIHFIASDSENRNCSAFQIKFDTDKFLWEMNYGREHLIERLLEFRLSGAVQKELQNVFLDICKTLDQEPKRISHRDYHSRNLMITLDKVRVIDFQDARLGPIQYDLVSLLRDSYVNIHPQLEKMIIDDYLAKASSYLEDFSMDQFQLIYKYQIIQRCFKACGSFASFLNMRDDRRYLKYLPKTLKTVATALVDFPEYRVFAEVLRDSGALEKNFSDKELQV